MDDYKDGELSDELAHLTTLLNNAYERERRIRISLLRLHAWMGISAGIAISFTGAGALMEQNFGIWIRDVLGLVSFTAGVVLLLGLRRKGGKMTMELLGLAMMASWYTAMILSFIGLIHGYGAEWTFAIPGLHTELPVDQPRPFPLLVYSTLTTMVLGVHLRAVLYDRRSRSDA